MANLRSPSCTPSHLTSVGAKKSRWNVCKWPQAVTLSKEARADAAPPVLQRNDQLCLNILGMSALSVLASLVP